ncbi:MAG: NAD(P)-dependent oxidoreductase [Dehalococcoidales bacterium]|nr:MAG: NAD(P)-dependent oxidoreductase [Dehalococcoidales bacterium]
MTVKMGFVGVGDIGNVMARSILKSGIPLTVYDLNEEAVDKLVTEGAVAAGSCRELMETSDAVISMVRDIPQTEEVVFGTDGLWKGAKEGSIIILSSTIGPSYPRELYEKGKEKGVRVIDIGVTKNIPTNEIGQFTLMVSGDDDVIDMCWPVFEAMGRKVFRAGQIGNGQAYKLVNNMVAFNMGTVIHECLNVGLKAGLDMKIMLDVMQEGTGASWMANSMRTRLESGTRGMPPPSPPTVDSPPPQFINKDQVLAIEMAEELGAEIPVAKLMENLDESKVYSAYTKFMRG